ncbi:MAG TPA: tetratricopeptide repeat protein [Opitutales bacterium]|nr:tetratricopeptide repeat protein [Opitutales bacterium]
MLASVAWCAGQTPPATAATPVATPATPAETAAQKLLQGDYADAVTITQGAMRNSYPSEALVRVAAEANLAQGKYNEAYAVLKSGLNYNSSSIRLSLLLYQACLYLGKSQEAQQVLADINGFLTNLAAQQQYTQMPIPASLRVAAGEAALRQGMDPKQLLQQFFQPGEQGQPPVREAFLDAGQLGLDKHDYNLASKSFGDGLRAFPDDADFLSGLAAAFRPTDREKFADYAKQALAANPRHLPTLVMLADNLIDAESYDQARELLQKILAINPHEQSALALLASIAYLRNQPGQGDAYRAQALSTWSANPRVDYLIGEKLSQNYRFELGAKFQRQALALDDKFTPARVQLAQDLLRLGQEDDGWAQAEKVHTDDGYDVEAFNLVTLHDEIAQYTTLKQDGFELRMEPTEARVYGARVLDLLKQARAAVATKYGVTLPPNVLVEFFPNAADFSVRTFGMPDIGEFLGVTFGPVVTINSPTTHDSNWEDVLWHEFTHVVTLTRTHNQMPRWLSEGISVYEEHQGRPEWGQLMSLEDAQRILAGQMQPISSMSAAFLQAQKMSDTQFAYFESELVVQYLLEKYGMDHLKALLQSLGSGMEMNEALAKNFAPVAQLDEDFANYAKAQVEKFAHGWTLAKPAGDSANLSGAMLSTPALVAAVDPHDLDAQLKQINVLMASEEWGKARDQIQAVNNTGLYLPGDENLYLMLANACAKLDDAAGEKAALTVVAAHEGDSLPAASRLLDIARKEQDWPAIAKWSNAVIAIHPTSVAGWRGQFDAGEQLHDNPAGIEAGLALLELQQPDEAAINYRVARLLQPSNPAAARRHVLEALEDAPRFRAAYELLSQLPPGDATATSASTPETSASTPQ